MAKKNTVKKKDKKLSTKTLILIIAGVVVVGGGLYFGISYLRTGSLTGGDMNASVIGTGGTTRQYRFYKWKSSCGCDTSDGVGEDNSKTSNNKYTDSYCANWCKNKYGSDDGTAANIKTSYTSLSNSSAVPSGYSASNRQTRTGITK